MKAQHAKESYTKKLDDEKAVIAQLQVHADVLQEEFTVCGLCLCDHHTYLFLSIELDG